jgi:hypothetical protein
MSPVRQFTMLSLLASLVACSGSPPPGPPYRQWGSPSAQEVRDQMKIGHAFEIETERAAQAFTENCGSYRVDRGLLVCIPAPPN